MVGYFRTIFQGETFIEDMYLFIDSCISLGIIKTDLLDGDYYVVYEEFDDGECSIIYHGEGVYSYTGAWDWVERDKEPMVEYTFPHAKESKQEIKAIKNKRHNLAEAKRILNEINTLYLDFEYKFKKEGLGAEFDTQSALEIIMGFDKR